jgi:hypothetical protein
MISDDLGAHRSIYTAGVKHRELQKCATSRRRQYENGGVIKLLYPASPLSNRTPLPGNSGHL